MAIYRLLQNSPLGPEEIAVLTDAYEGTLRAVGLVDRSDPVTELIAKKVLELAQRGVREAKQLSALAVEELGTPSLGPTPGTRPDDYLARAEHYRKAANEMGVDSFTRYHLQAMERSYRTLAESEPALRASVKRTEALRKLECKDDQGRVP
jgi:hypothetical protein